MRHSLYLPVLLTPMIFMTGCSMGHKSHEGSENHHMEGGDMQSDGHAGNHDDSEHHDGSVGKPGDASSVDRVISVVMDDTMRFIPDSFNVIAGETIQFDVVNQGDLVHEFVLGSAEELQEHHAMMQKSTSMQHDEANSVSLQTDAAGTLIWTFTNSGEVDIACLKPGHFEAGMKGSVVVSSTE